MGEVSRYARYDQLLEHTGDVGEGSGRVRGNVKRAGGEGMGRALMVLGVGVMRREKRRDDGGEGAVDVDDGQVLLWMQGPRIARRERDGGSAGDGKWETVVGCCGRE